MSLKERRRRLERLRQVLASRLTTVRRHLFLTQDPHGQPTEVCSGCGGSGVVYTWEQPFEQYPGHQVPNPCACQDTEDIIERYERELGLQDVPVPEGQAEPHPW